VIVQNFVKSAKRFLKYRDFVFFSRWPPSAFAVRHLAFLIFLIFVCPSGLEANIHRYNKFHQISRTAADISNLTFFKMAAVLHLDFSKN